MMKLLAIFLFFLISAGSFIPCCQDECAAETFEPAGNSQEEKEGSCSPLFSCAANPAFVVLSNVEFLSPIYVYRLQHEAQFIHLDLKAYTTQILQPPRTKA